jgi:predicted Zn-dependent peptidase
VTTFSADQAVEFTQIANGPGVVSEQVSDAHSVAVGIWVGVGARDESEHQAGISHFLEHLVFKGTEERTARSIAELADATGGEMNAFTTMEYTAFYARFPANKLDLAIDLLGDVLCRPALRATDIETERQVILEELHLAIDDPTDALFGLLHEGLFPKHPLSREVIGTENSVMGLDRSALMDFHDQWYRAPNLVVAAAGAVDHQYLVERFGQVFAERQGGVSPARSQPTLAPVVGATLQRPIEATHLAWGWLGASRLDPRRYALTLGVHILGGGMSSRLFQKVREERGLTYSVFATRGVFEDAGVVSIYAGTAPDRAEELAAVVAQEVAEIADHGVTEEELAIARSGFEGSLLLGLEDTGSRMRRLGSNQLLTGTVMPLKELVEAFRAVTVAEINQALAEVFSVDAVTTQVGPNS